MKEKKQIRVFFSLRRFVLPLLLFVVVGLASGIDYDKEAEIYRDFYCPEQNDVCFINFLEELPEGGYRIIHVTAFFDRVFGDIMVLPDVIINPNQ